MEALKKQASKLREHVAKQQQAVRKTFSARYNPDTSLVDEAELECHHNLQALYNSTRAAKQFQRTIVRGVEGFVAVSTKQMEIVKKLAEDCCKYGNNNLSSGFALGRASVEFGKTHSQMEVERDKLLKVLGEQVFEPLREMIMSAPLEDARLLTYRYQRIRQDMESQIADVMRKQLKSKESSGNADSAKLQHAESKLSELRTTLAALGREATAAMEAVEVQQQQVTFDRLLAMVDAERTYHQTVADILNKLHDEMLLAKHHEESDNNHDEPSSEPSPEPKISSTHAHSNSTSEDPAPAVPETSEPTRNGQEVNYVGEVIHPFDAQADGELSIAVGDFVVVRQVSPNGWSEGECKGKAGWFPSAYVEQRDKAPASKVIEPGRLTA
ncbi:SH3 domain-containing protein 2-like [Lolium rigidum]|uniref:SH3 domain-containing protein 2-like n=1 Tax=Lolium rigidum TaxID=89674 RepID=UPI001F5E0F57|nr:SH3 domain-containing protein 2-like [Lolium rigidum]XP_047090094.1 SH3 domain-containing protein 2-like [Lolium rigidum]